MKVSVEIEVPDGKHCNGCSKLFRKGYTTDRFYCGILSHDGAYYLSYDKRNVVNKHPECAALPSLMECGHHPDAVGVDHDYRDDSPFSYCVACKKEKQSEDFHGMLQIVNPENPIYKEPK